MSDVDRFAIWSKIEQLAFRPQEKEMQSWLSMYRISLHTIWQIHASRSYLKSKDTFNIPFLNLKCDYQIEYIKNKKKYSVTLRDLSTNGGKWQIHVDPKYDSKSSLQTSQKKCPQKESKLRCDITKVLDGMLFHPRCHTHLEDIGIPHTQLDQNSNKLSLHDIRIGGGIENPYVFLLHLRYQFCLIKQAREKERTRLIDLFRVAIQDNKKQTVNASDLLNYRQ